jgi:hypothetical protein
MTVLVDIMPVLIPAFIALAFTLKAPRPSDKLVDELLVLLSAQLASFFVGACGSSYFRCKQFTGDGLQVWLGRGCSPCPLSACGTSETLAGCVTR